MARPILATKLYIPKLRRGLVRRRRLGERMRRGAGLRLVLVSAPAGFGKTTLLTEWLDETSGEDRRVAWVSLDPADSEPASFWTYLVTAIRTAVPEVGSEALELVASSPLPTELALTTLLNELAAVPDSVWLVLDDYHLVDGHDVGEGMTFLVEHLPPHVHVVLSTRADPGLPLSRWRVRDEMVEIRAADLRFTCEETTAYLNDVMGLDLATEDVVALEQRTEGWVAALQLAALSIRGRDDAADFVSRFAGNDRYIVDYLVEEVLQHQSDPVRSFLVHSAVLDRLTGPLCDAVMGREDGGQMLTALERANLFIVPLDDQRKWYRYHHLFSDVLHARLLGEHPEQIPLLHQRASSWYEAHDQAENAVRHALAAADFDRAGHLIEMMIPVLRRDRQDAMTHSWLRILPDDVVRRNPVLSVFYAGMLMASGDLDGVEPCLQNAERVLEAVPDRPTPCWADTGELRTLPATIAIYRASLAQARGDMHATADHARRALDLAGAHDHLALGAARGFLGLVAWAEGNVPTALETFTRAVGSLNAAGNLVDQLSSTVVLADMWLAAGRPSMARRLYEGGLQLAETEGELVAQATADLHVGLSEIYREAGDLSVAMHHLEAAAPSVHRGPMTARRYRWFVAMGLTAHAEGDPEKAIRFLEEAEPLYRPGILPEVRPIAAMKARVRIRQGKLSEAADWARERGVSVADDARYLREFDHLTLVRLLLAQQRARPDTDTVVGVTRLLERLLEHAGTFQRAGSLLEIRMLQALTHEAQGHRLQAQGMLALALREAPESCGFVRLLLDEGTPMINLLREASRHLPTADHAHRLLDLATPAEAQSSNARQVSPSSSAKPLSERELQVLRHLDSDLSGPDIAKALFISYNTLRTHTKHIFAKLEVTDRRAAVRRACERGLM